MATHVQRLLDPALPAAPALALAICPDGRCVLTSGLDFHLRKWDLEAGVCTHNWDARGPLYAIKTLPFENSALLAAVQGIVRWDLQAWERQAANSLWSYASIQAIGYSSSTGEVLGASEDSTIHRWILESGEKLDSLTGHRSSVSALDVNPPGRLALSGDLYGELRLWDLESSRCLQIWQGHETKVCAIAISADTSWAATCSQDGQLSIWDYHTAERMMTLTVDTLPLHAVALPEDGSWIVAGGEGGLYQWNLKTGCLEARYEQARVTDLALTADERSIIAVVRSNDLLIWPVG